MMIDADGLERVDLIWSIEGKDAKGQATLIEGQFYECHEQEVALHTRTINQRARRGDTVTIRPV